MRPRRLAVLTLLSFINFTPAFAQSSSPQINAVSPTTARAGDQIVINGSNFGSSQGNGNVWLGSTYGVVASWSDTQVVANVASGSKSGVAQILQGGVWSNPVNFTVITPNITGVTPTTAIAEAQITVMGTGFGATQGSGNVWLGSTYGVVVSWSDTQVLATVASGSKSGVAQVLQGGVWSNSVNFTVTTPSITSVSPTTGVAGTQITVTGTGFGATQGSGNVWLGSTYGVVMNWSDTQIVANVASGSKSGVAQVLQGGVWSNTVSLTVSTPNITSVTPTTAMAGTQITITGTGFGASQGSGNVWLGSTYGVVVSWSDTQIVANVASGSKTGVAQVLQGGVWSNTVNLTVSTPNIASVTPSTAIAGTQITITGTGFGASQGSGNVWLGSTYGVVVSWSDTQVVATVAIGSQTGVAQALQGGVWSNSVQFTIGAPAVFVTTGSLNIARELHTATVLNNGLALLAGGQNSSVRALASSELYDPVAGTFSVAANLNTGRYSHTATLLNDGTVLIAGGNDSSGNNLASVELYNPSTRTFTPINNMSIGRYLHTATLLTNGTVLVAGGYDSNHFDSATAEVYNPATATFTATGNLSTARAYHAATLLNDGTVLLTGGYDSNGNNLTSAELYNPATGTFTATGSLIIARNSHTATLLNNGRVLIAGGFDDIGNVIAAAELYNPATGLFTTTGNPNTPRDANTATLLNNGTVLFAGGYDTNFNDAASAELYDSSIGAFVFSSNANIARDSHTATLLGDGTVLIAGGVDSSGTPLATAELYKPGTLTPSGLVSIAINPLNPSFGLATPQHFTPTGTFRDNSTQILGSVTWSSSDNTIATVTNDATNRGNSFALASGSVTVNACAGSVCGSTLLTVTPSTLSSIAITPANQILLTGLSIQFRAIGTFVDGGTEDLTASVTWNSSSLLVATINSVGSASAFTKGTTMITASFGGVTGSTSLTVTPPLAAIAVFPQNAYAVVGGTQQFTAIGTYSDGSTVDLTNSVTWSSSANAMVTINSAGLATAAAQGTATITASSSGTRSTATLTITTPLVSIAINPQSPSIPSGLKQLLGAIGTYADGTVRDLTISVNWNSSTATVATVSSAGLVTAVGQGTTTISATSGSIATSTTLTVAGPALLMAAISPQNPFVPPGTTQQFTVAGRYSDGSTQDLTASVGWSSSNTSVATVSASGLATAASTGSATMTASVNGFTFSTNVTVTAPGPPAITASISPVPNAAGWNNSNVTVTFTCTPGSAAITSCPGPQVAMSEGTNQVVRGTVTDAAGATATASTTLNIDKTRPTLVVASPADGAVFTAAGGITASGTVSDGLSGINSLTCNGVPVTLTGTDFSCNISLNPGVNLVVVRATDSAGNVALTKMHVKLDAPLPLPNSLQITPANVNLAVGDTQQFTAVDDLGRPRADATWTVSDTTVATITTDGKPVLTALAVGQVTLTATVQGVYTQVQLNILGGSLAPGTVRWGIQSPPGSEPQGVVPAVPTADGPGYYVFTNLETSNTNKNITLSALTADGQLLWQQPPANQQWLAVPDAIGGAIMNDGNRLVALDGQTGAPVWQYSSQNGLDSPAIRPDGAVVAIELEGGGPTPLGKVYIARKFLDVFDGNTGQLTLQIPLPQYTQSFHTLSTVYSSDGTFIADCQPWGFEALMAGPTSQATVGTNGNIYIEYSVPNVTHTLTNCHSPVLTEVFDSSTVLLTVSPDGSSSVQTLGSGTQRATCFSSTQTLGIGCMGGDVTTLLVGQNYLLIPTGTVAPSLTSGSGATLGQVIPDGQGGALATWEILGSFFDPPQPVMVTHVSPTGGGTYSLPLDEADQLVLGENGVAFATGLSLGTVDHKAISFDMNSGQVVWSYQSSAPNVISMIAATPGGGLVAQGRNQSGVPRIFRFDSNGLPTEEDAPDRLIGADWFGELYDADGVLGSTAVDWAISFWATPLGSPSLNNGSANMPWYPPLPTCPSAKGPCAGEAVWNAFKALKTLVGGSCSQCDMFVFSKIGLTKDSLNILINKPPLLSDGTRSGARATTALCGHALAAFGCPAGPLQTVAEFMRAKGNPSAVSQTPSPNGLVIFFDPGSICTAGTSVGGFLNEATIFHEALHGLTGLGDSDLEKKLGIAASDVSNFGSASISYYLETNIFGTTLHYFDPGGTAGLVCKEQ